MGMLSNLGGTIGKRINPKAPQTDNRESILTWLKSEKIKLQGRKDLGKEYMISKKGNKIATIDLWNYNEDKNQTSIFLKCRNRKLYDYEEGKSIKEYESGEAWYDFTTKEDVSNFIDSVIDLVGTKNTPLANLDMCYIKGTKDPKTEKMSYEIVKLVDNT
jgi:hypothetical protein